MNAIIPMLSIMLLTGPEELPDFDAAVAVSAEADRVEDPTRESYKDCSMRITSVRSDFDRVSGVVMFEGGVLVNYGNGECTMSSDRLFAFVGGTNELSRIVAVGNVAITNETRVGFCTTAVYRRKTSEIEMHGDGRDVLARLVDIGEGGGDVSGSRIRFRLDSEKIEVENSSIRMERQEGSKAL